MEGLKIFVAIFLMILIMAFVVVEWLLEAIKAWYLRVTTNVSRPINVNIHYENKYEFYETHTTRREKVPKFILTTISHLTLWLILASKSFYSNLANLIIRRTLANTASVLFLFIPLWGFFADWIAKQLVIVHSYSREHN